MHDVIDRADSTTAHTEHTPQYSWAPLIIGVGTFFINAGFVFGLPVGIFGLLVFLSGVATWIREDIHLWARGSDEHGGH